jgi:hypothetical protein
MKQQKRVWQSVVSTQIESEFIEDDLTCPTCESYNVDERVSSCTCTQCGESWANELMRK